MQRRAFLRNSLLGGTAAALGGGMIAFPRPAISENHKKLRMQTAWPEETSGPGAGALYFSEYVTLLSEGRLVVELHWDTPERSAFDAMSDVQSGDMDMGHSAPYYWKGALPAADFLSGIPFGFTSMEMDAWLQFGGGKELTERAYRDVGCKFLACGVSGQQMAGWFSQPVSETSDLSNLRIRMPGLGGEVCKAAGASVVLLPGSEIPKAIEAGVIDAASWMGPYADDSLGLAQSGWSYGYPGWQAPSVLLDAFINLDVWGRLDSTERTLLQTAARLAHQQTQSEFQAHNQSALRRMVEEQGIELFALSDQTLASLADLSGEVMNDLAAVDPFSHEVFQSILRFRQDLHGWSKYTDLAMLQARQLKYNFPTVDEDR
ncbi:TRAP transporter substrate-binding protein [Fodinicurvata fenggangensis]|uniref:TRAP transporter substrate-binding protein n=1 Tax=Fodinicurvata fenggangensis TaxID=1121830 RepID=UPI00047AB146|nr:hypothetical protein [Fodinicurvata fenggangensis]